MKKQLSRQQIDGLRLKWQYRRLMLEIPLVIYLIHLSAHEYGWPITLYWLKYFAVNVSILVTLTKKLKWM